jgi:hypothetical protein
MSGDRGAQKAVEVKSTPAVDLLSMWSIGPRRAEQGGAGQGKTKRIECKSSHIHTSADTKGQGLVVGRPGTVRDYCADAVGEC